MGKIITIANQKGGVGKTLTASSMASLLYAQGHNILTISLNMTFPFFELSLLRLFLSYKVQLSELK